MGVEATEGPTRRELGAFYTPPEIVEALLDEALDPVLGERATDEAVLAIRVLDPACGDGAFLIAAVARIAARLVEISGGSADQAFRRVVDAGCVVGMDVDPPAIRTCAEALGSAAWLRLEDALVTDPNREFDVVVGNPPFLSQLDRRTAVSSERRAVLQERYPMDAYTDPSALFLLLAARSLRTGGRMAMVQPLSVLAARDAERVRIAVEELAPLAFVWVAGGRVFPDAQVQVCALGAVEGADGSSVHLSVGGGFRHVGDRERGDASWAALGAQAMGVPDLAPQTDGLLGDLAVCTADFRDAFYRLAGAVREGDVTDTRDRLVTTAMIDPAVIAWGAREVRFAGERYLRPIVQTQTTDSELAAWVAKRAVPKVLVATQTRVIEAAIDPNGATVPVTPVISVVPGKRGNLPRVAAVLSSPVAAALATSASFGAALSPNAIKLSAAQVREIPLPAHREPWTEAASFIERAHAAEGVDERWRYLERAGRSMLVAYGLPSNHEVFGWWASRLRSRRRA